jgi:hypothetical protein
MGEANDEFLVLLVHVQMMMVFSGYVHDVDYCTITGRVGTAT